MDKYQHLVQYYETDKMGITHHSNYIRWMEEARIQALCEIGWPYEKLEAIGIGIPVIGIEAKYKKSTTFADTVFIELWLEEFRSVKMKIGYRMTNVAGETVLEGASEHCFLNAQGGVIRVQREYPELADALRTLSKES